MRHIEIEIETLNHMPSAFDGLFYDTDFEAPSLITTSPTPGRFYAIQASKGGLLTTTSRAYNVGSGRTRLKLAQKINNHPLNKKFWATPKSDFNKKFFPSGLISFNPRFTCREDQRRAKSGEKKCFARIWIPPVLKSHHPQLGRPLSIPASYFFNSTAPR